MQWYRHYRQGRNHRSLDPDADTIRSLICTVAAASGQEPVGVPKDKHPAERRPGFGHITHGVFGLPINLQQIKPDHADGTADFGKVEIMHKSGKRMSSAVIVKARLGSKHYEAIALMMPEKYIEQALTAEVVMRWNPTKNRASPARTAAHYIKDCWIDLNGGKATPVWNSSLSGVPCTMRYLSPGAANPLAGFLDYMPSFYKSGLEW